jgi:hypothetical protein
MRVRASREHAAVYVFNAAGCRSRLLRERCGLRSKPHQGAGNTQTALVIWFAPGGATVRPPEAGVARTRGSLRIY